MLLKNKNEPKKQSSIQLSETSKTLRSNSLDYARIQCEHLKLQ